MIQYHHVKNYHVGTENQIDICNPFFINMLYYYNDDV